MIIPNFIQFDPKQFPHCFDENFGDLMQGFDKCKILQKNYKSNANSEIFVPKVATLLL